MKQRMAVVLLLALVAAACSSTDATNDASPETSQTPTTQVTTTAPAPFGRDATDPIYESLQLETPGMAVQSLISAHDDRDFVRAWLIFDIGAQQRMFRALNNLDLSEVRTGRHLLPANLIEGSGEHVALNGISMVSRLLEDAAHLGYLHVDFAGANVLSSEIGVAGPHGSSMSVVTVRLSDETEAQLHMTKTESERWRVSQVATDGVDFDNSGSVFVDTSCVSYRVRVHPGAECPSTEASIDEETQEEVKILIEDAGDDINKQIANAQQIQDLINASLRISDEELFANLQGNGTYEDSAITDQTLARAEALIEITCPGDLGLLGNPPETPLSGAVIGERTVYGRLDLGTPESAVETFGELFYNEAFMLLSFSLDAEAQGKLTRAINNINFYSVVDGLVVVFASLMREASENGLHLLDLSGPLEVLGTTSTTWTEPRSEAVDAQIVEARSEMTGTIFHFLMLESASGRWPVRQVATDAPSFDSNNDPNEVFLTP